MKRRTIGKSIYALFVAFPAGLLQSYVTNIWRCRFVIAFGVLVYIGLVAVLHLGSSWHAYSIANVAYGDPYIAHRRLQPFVGTIMLCNLGICLLSTLAAITVRSSLPLRFERRGIWLSIHWAVVGIGVVLMVSTLLGGQFVPGLIFVAAKTAVGTSATPMAALISIEWMILKISSLWFVVGSISLCLWVPLARRLAI